MINKQKSDSNNFESVFVLGGTSEIAQEICFELIKKGTKKIHLVSKNTKKAESFMKRITRNYSLEITNQKFDLLKEDLRNDINIGFFDLYIIAAGYLGNSNLANNDVDEALKIARVNYYSLIPWIIQITTEYRISKPGSMWILSSVAGDIGRPSNYQYGSAKAALTIFCEGLLNRCQNSSFKVRIIKAGLIKTNMSFGKAPPFIYMSKESFAKNLIRKGNQEGIEYWPWWWKLIINFISILPRSIISKL
tara:strand:- start:1882 stop:2628 length:747 start_codon:yes stop_codon:yes gene_type:complete